MTLSPIYWEYANNNYFGVAQDLKSVKENLKTLEMRDNNSLIKQGEYNSFLQPKENPYKIVFKDIAPINPATKSIAEVSEKIKEKEYTSGFLIASQAALDLPNVIDDTIDAIDLGSKFIKSGMTNDKRYTYMYKKAYDWKKAQHPFSYFRGTLIKDYINPNHPKCVSKKFALKVNKMDKSLIETKIGKIFRENFNLKKVEIKTNIKSLKSTPQSPKNIKAYQFIGKSATGKLVARSMTRVPVIGLAMSGAIETTQVIKDIKEGEKAIKAIGKGVARLTSSTAITAVLGAVGAMVGGPFGSMAGIIISGFINNAIAKAIG